MTVSFVFSLIFKVTRLHGHAYRVLFAFNLIPFRTGRNSILTLYDKISFHSNKMDQEHVYCISIFFFKILFNFSSFWETQRIEISFLLKEMKNFYISDIYLKYFPPLPFLNYSLFHIYIYNLIFHIRLCNIYFICINFYSFFFLLKNYEL